MLFAFSFSGLQTILLGLSILAAAFLLRRAALGRRRPREHRTVGKERQGLDQAERSVMSEHQKLEVRLHDYQREVEGRIQTTLTLLECLIHEADEESRRLQNLLEESRRQREANGHDADKVRHSHAPRPLTEAERQMVGELKRAGYSPREIARLLRRDERDIEPESPDAGKADAA